MNLLFIFTNFKGFINYGFCPKCGSGKTEVRNYDSVWRDGAVHCSVCETYVRMYDAG